MVTIKAIIFDLDNTLYNEKEYIFSGFRKVAEYLVNKYGFSFQEIYDILVTDFEKGLRGKNFDELLNKIGIKEDIEVLITVYRTHYPQIKLFNDAQYILDYLYSMGIKLGLITDGPPASQYNKIMALGLRKYFDVIIVTDELGVNYRKPHPKPYLLVLKILNVKPQESIFVSDSDQKDLAGAKAIGMWTVLVDRYNTYKKSLYADYVVNNLLELRKIIKEIGV